MGAHDRLCAPPSLPELVLHMTGDILDVWERTRLGRDADEVPLPFWAAPWPGGLALARYVLDHAGVVAGRTVWDPAAGCGVVAIAAARAGAGRVTASDVDPNAVAAIRRNVAANGVTLTVRREDAAAAEHRADVVLAGDVFYDAATAGQALRLLERAHAAGALVLVGDPGRRHLPRSRLAPVASYRIAGTGALEASDVTPTTVWRLA